MNITYPNIEQTYTPAAVVGSSISSIPADKYVAVPLSDGMRFYTFGPAWAGVLWKFSLPLPPVPNQGTATLSFDVMPDDAVPVFAQALEFDTMFTDRAGNVYNFSSQLNLAEGGNEQIVNSTYKWQDIGFNPGALPQGEWTHFEMKYAFDTAKQTSSVVSAAVGGTYYQVPQTMQNIPAQKLGWGANLAIVQVQLDINGKGGAFSHKVRNLTFSASW